MKNINILLVLLAAIFGISCEDFLDAPAKSSLDENIIFSTPALAEEAIAGITVSFSETDSYRGRFLPHYGANTDCEWLNSTSAGAKLDLAAYNAAPSNSEMNKAANAWAKMYEGIERANLAIRGLRASGEANPGTPLGHLLGEALTLRAVYYADLVKAWGDVPARFEPNSTQTIYLPKSDRDVIYKEILSNLEEAETLVYWPNEHEYTKVTTRVNKAFVKGFYARVALNASGYSQRPDGTIRLSNDPELTKEILYPKAKEKLLSIAGHADLEKPFEKIFKKICQDDITAGGESLWEIPFSDTRGRMAFTFAIRHLAKDQYTDMSGRGSDHGPTPNFFYDYDVEDTRRDVTCVPYLWSNSNPSYQELDPNSAVNKWSFGKYRFEWMKRILRGENLNDDGLNKQYMRYGEVFLMLAEIENELSGPSAAAPYLKEIRKRAFPEESYAEKVEKYVNQLTSKQDMFNAIVDEYAFEFAGEMLRKECLIRWNLLKTKMDETKVKMAELRDQRGRYADVPSTVFYKYAEDGETLITYGFNRGETENKTDEYPYSIEWVGSGKLKDDKINNLYIGNPDTHQFWPIWQVFLDNSNGMLVNDYGY